ncbi:MAG: hypothetical protein ABFS35_02235 [Bacteroidota bacterium]
MQTKSIERESLELKVFAFSVDVVSFVKSLEKAGRVTVVINNLLNLANEFYLNYLAAEEALGEYDKKTFLEESKDSAKKCLKLLQSIKVEKEFLNEKVDLIIEIAELIREIGSK